MLIALPLGCKFVSSILVQGARWSGQLRSSKKNARRIGDNVRRMKSHMKLKPLFVIWPFKWEDVLSSPGPRIKQVKVPHLHVDSTILLASIPQIASIGKSLQMIPDRREHTNDVG